MLSGTFTTLKNRLTEVIEEQEILQDLKDGLAEVGTKLSPVDRDELECLAPREREKKLLGILTAELRRKADEQRLKAATDPTFPQTVGPGEPKIPNETTRSQKLLSAANSLQQLRKSL